MVTGHAMKPCPAAIRERQIDMSLVPPGRSRERRLSHISPTLGRTRSTTFEIDMTVGTGRLSK